ncbi:hypothetical protein [Teichococcus aestuarii]|uniref:hypothetical protein n=1 Tax=Teichococcus aestuarii TaxID=568898 RepID=UPI00361F08CE
MPTGLHPGRRAAAAPAPARPRRRHRLPAALAGADPRPLAALDAGGCRPRAAAARLRHHRGARHPRRLDHHRPRDTTLLVHTPQGVWRVEALVADLAAGPRALPLEKADGIVSTALCDLVSRRWVRRMAEALAIPFYAALNVDGREGFYPSHPADRLLARGFRRDQIRDKGFGGAALGPAAPAAMAAAFRARGFAVRTAPSPWIIGANTPVMADSLAEGHAGAALAALPRGHGPAIRAWAEARRAQAMRGRLSARIGHTDLLALPPPPKRRR